MVMVTVALNLPVTFALYHATTLVILGKDVNPLTPLQSICVLSWSEILLELQLPFTYPSTTVHCLCIRGLFPKNWRNRGDHWTETEKESSPTDNTVAETNPHVDIGMLSHRDGRDSSPVQAAYEPTWESGSLQQGPVREIVEREIANTGKPVTPHPCILTGIGSGRMARDNGSFFNVTGVPFLRQAVTETPCPDPNGHGESLIQLAVRFDGLKQQKNQSFKKFAQEVTEWGRRIRKSFPSYHQIEDLFSRFICEVSRESSVCGS
ncbi:hypothetical protein T4A_5910 [Trichinella pseudospiralis]|uniref:Uncharacterized protein n=1 Tax=Trichinella pseudospiralis TaxID=6337 RepID=A0A0V1E7D3_TRIPS|nr:hypothetical protein T4A_5910 [Trichinella pseudospiralis]